MSGIEYKPFLLQKQLGDYCRNGENQPKTSIQKHTYQYRRLVFNIQLDTMARAFPLTKKIVGEEEFKSLVNEFFKSHSCGTPQIWKLPEEFLYFYIESNHKLIEVFPHLIDLLRYEWLEIEGFMMEDESVAKFTIESKSDKSILVPNPELRIFSMEYPINTKKISDISLKDKGQYFVSFHRDFYTKKVVKSNLYPPEVEMILKVNETPTNENELKTILLKYEQNQTVIDEFFSKFLVKSKKINLILGYEI